MRPHSLQLQGFTAFRELQTIDFTALDLFVITGPTGAGKTSLIDAMSLALYGRVPRMGSQGLGQLVSHGQAEARIQLEFGVNGDVYRIARRLRRNGNQFATFERRAGDRWVDVTERGGVRAVNEAVTERVVLDFESFCKAIVLPQGEFARFLKGDPPERRRTLVTLLGLGAYERMGALARERARELRIRAEQTQSILEEQFADATPAALADAKAELDAATHAAQRASELLTQARAADASRVDAETRADATLRLGERFAALANDLTSEVATCRSAEAARTDALERHELARASAEAAALALQQADSAYAALVAREGAAEELARLLDALHRRRVEDERVDDAERELAAAWEVEQQRRRALEQAVRRATEDADVAAAAREGEAAARRLDEKCRAERDRAVQRHDDAVRAHAALTQVQSEVSALEARAATAKAACERARELHLELEQRLEASRRENLVAALIADVDLGAPCPVCARPLAEHPEVDPDVAERLAAEEADCAAARDEAARAQTASASAAGALREARARLAELTRARDGEDLEALAAGAERAKRTADESARALTEAIARRERADAAGQRSNATRERARAELEAAAEMVAARQAALTKAKDARDATQAILQHRFGAEVPEDAAEQITAARAALRAAEERLQLARRAESEARDALRGAEQALQAAQATLAGIDVRLGELRSRAETACEDAAAADLPSLPAAREARDARAADLAEWCRLSAELLTERRAALLNEAAIAAGRVLTLAAEAELVADDASTAVEQLARYERDCASARVRAEAAATALAGRVEQRAQMEADIAQSGRKTAVLDVLARDLRADHFIDFVVQETLDLLALRATEELRRISDDRYSLVSSEGSFNVIDHVNADEQRSVKTLSGGETFMASLSLALALSKHVSELAGEGLGARLEAVFIDEGFGSLDPETLDDVIDALERLREDELLVGVISHVPALAERIRGGLEVRTNGGHSSVVPAA